MTDTTTELAWLRSEVATLRASGDATERRLRASHAVARVLAEAGSIDEALPMLLGALAAALDCTLADFWVTRGDELVARTTWAASEPATFRDGTANVTLRRGQGLPGRVWQTGQPVWLEDVPADDSLPRRSLLTAAQIRSGIGFAVTTGSEIVGVIELFSQNREGLDAHLVDVLRAIGGHLGRFVQNLETQTRLVESVARRERMAQATARLSETLDVEAITGELARVSVPWLGDSTAVYLAQPNGSLVAAALEHGDPTKLARMLEHEGSVPHAPGRSSHVLAAATTRETQFMREVAPHLDALAATVEDREALRSLELASSISVPLVTRAELIGVLWVATTGGRRLERHDVALVEELASRAALAIANARLYEAAQATARELAAERETLTKLNDVGRTISAELDQQVLVQAVTDVATHLTRARFGAFFYHVRSDRGDSYMLYAVSGAPRDAFAKFPLPRATQVFAPTFQNKGVVRLDDVTRDPRYGKNAPHHGMPEGHLPVKSYLAVPVASRSGEVIGGLFFGHDAPGVFTERAERLAVGLASHAATAMDNARLFADQQRLIKALEKTNDELDQFAYAASHDLRAPLRGIANLASWIEADLGATTPKVREHLALLKGRTTRMDKLIQGLLELARIGRTRHEPERVDVTELLHDTIDLVGAPDASRVLIIGAMPMMFAERFALQQVLLNLIGNAVQHAGREDVVVRITASERVHEYELAVSDDGVGIAPEHHERVWQMFQTLHARDVVESTGVGLAIVKKQVEANGGRAWIDPHGPGTTIRFTWPKKLA